MFKNNDRIVLLERSAEIQSNSSLEYTKNVSHIWTLFKKILQLIAIRS